MSQPPQAPVQSRGEHRSSLDSQDSGGAKSTIWADVDRDGFPEPSDKKQPWKDNNLGPTQPETPDGRSIFGRAWDSVMVAVYELVDMGTGST